MKSPPPPPGFSPLAPAGRARAFTLIELLASMTVLALLLTVVVQMINSAIAVTAGSAKRLDADSQARLVFDRMAADFSQIAKRLDTDYYLQKNAVHSALNGVNTHGNDQMAFYSETSGYYPKGISEPSSFVPKSNTSLIGYRIYEKPSTDPASDIPPRLERLSKALVWNGVTSSTTGATGLPSTPRALTLLPQTLPLGWPTVFSASTDPTVSGSPSGIPDMCESTDIDYQVVGEQVFRMEISYLVRNSITPATLSDTPYLPTPTSPPGLTNSTVLPYNGLRDVTAIVVTLAILDGTSRLTVQDADLDNTADLLDDYTGSTLMTGHPTTPASVWQAHIDKGDLIKPAGGNGLPKAAAAQVRVYERYFYLGNAQ